MVLVNSIKFIISYDCIFAADKEYNLLTLTNILIVSLGFKKKASHLVTKINFPLHCNGGAGDLEKSAIIGLTFQ